MAHSLSAKKRVRQNLKRRMINRARKGAIKKQIRRFEADVRQSSDMENLEQQFRLVQKKLDRVAAQGTMHRNTVARRKSRLARQLHSAKARLA